MSNSSNPSTNEDDPYPRLYDFWERIYTPSVYENLIYRYGSTSDWDDDVESVEALEGRKGSEKRFTVWAGRRSVTRKSRSRNSGSIWPDTKLM